MHNPAIMFTSESQVIPFRKLFFKTLKTLDYEKAHYPFECIGRTGTGNPAGNGYHGCYRDGSGTVHLRTDYNLKKY